MLSNESALELMREAGSLWEGHFLLTSGKHSARYLQCAKIFQNTKYSELFCKDLAQQFKNDNIDIVIGPAMGAIQMAYEVSRHLEVPNFFAERDGGVMTLRRGFEISKGQRVLIVEDVVTTGGSVKEVMQIVKDAGGIVAGVGAIADRTGGKIDFGVPFKSVLSIEIEAYEPDKCPLCKEGVPIVKPGSKKISK